MNHIMNLNPEPFELIKCRIKTIELRLYDEKRKLIQVGDNIIFHNTSTSEALHTAVIALHLFPDFSALYQALPLLKCGYTEADVHTADPRDMEQYYSTEEQKEYGVIGIELKLS